MLENIDGKEVQRIPRQIILREENIMHELDNINGYYSKLYLANREEALEIYKKMKADDGGLESAQEK